ncbi:MAG: KTSC domain-containing protein [Burkholderiales bacterium]|nr:MAG: KTSC domain-containing protein [Burkholderiales bacterium]
MNRKPLSSGKLKSAGYDESARVMHIEFTNGDVYEYKSVSREIYRQLMTSPSPSSFFQDKIDEQFSSQRLSRVPKSENSDSFDDLFRPD